jgi:hypothetical protein
VVVAVSQRPQNDPIRRRHVGQAFLPAQVRTGTRAGPSPRSGDSPGLRMATQLIPIVAPQSDRLARPAAPVAEPPARTLQAAPLLPRQASLDRSAKYRKAGLRARGSGRTSRPARLPLQHADSITEILAHQRSRRIHWVAIGRPGTPCWFLDHNCLFFNGLLDAPQTIKCPVLGRRSQLCDASVPGACSFFAHVSFGTRSSGHVRLGLVVWVVRMATMMPVARGQGGCDWRSPQYPALPPFDSSIGVLANCGNPPSLVRSQWGTSGVARAVLSALG